MLVGVQTSQDHVVVVWRVGILRVDCLSILAENGFEDSAADNDLFRSRPMHTHVVHVDCVPFSPV